MPAWKRSRNTSNATPCHCNFPFSRVVLGVHCARNISFAKLETGPTYIVIREFQKTAGFLSQYLTNWPFTLWISSICKCAYIHLVFSIIYQLVVAQGKFERKKSKSVIQIVGGDPEVKFPSTHWPVCRPPVVLVSWVVLAAPIVELELDWSP